MWKKASALAVLVLLWLPSLAFAQDNEEQGPPAPVFQYLFSALTALIILVIACVPSRRAYPQKEAE